MSYNPDEKPETCSTCGAIIGDDDTIAIPFPTKTYVMFQALAKKLDIPIYESIRIHGLLLQMAIAQGIGIEPEMSDDEVVDTIDELVSKAREDY